MLEYGAVEAVPALLLRRVRVVWQLRLGLGRQLRLGLGSPVLFLVRAGTIQVERRH